MSTTFWTTTETPDGSFTVVAAAEAVLAAGWTADVGALLALVHPSLRPGAAELRRAGARSTGGAGEGTGPAVAAVTAYYDGDLEAPGRVPVLQRSGAFREHAWEVLRTVQPGERVSYARYAELSGRPTAVRAAAAACSRNAAALFVPCHRVVRSDGGLGGFRYGLAIKQRLQDRELSA